MMRTISTTKGFSLVEVMVYLAVTVFLAGALVTTFLSLNTVLARNATERALTMGAQVSLERVVRAARSADTVHTGLSTLDSSMGALALTEGATTTRFYVSGDALMLSVNGTDLGPLTSDGVSVEDVVFHRYVASTSEMIRMELTLSAIGKASSSTRTFYSSAVLRGSYE
jgi:type II secretory pathway pseudopilin PulG